MDPRQSTCVLHLKQRAGRQSGQDGQGRRIALGKSSCSVRVTIKNRSVSGVDIG
jgi:hypothetical protein